MIIDLHTHSYYSADGKLSIPELLSFYSTGDIVALTDHETIAGWAEFREEALRRGIRPVFGVEWFIKNSCHILSYFVSEIPQYFKDFMAERRVKEQHCMRLMYARAKEEFPSIPTYEEVLASQLHPENILGLTALARYMEKEANLDFKKAVGWLREERGKISECDKPVPFYPGELIRQIKDLNGIPVLAHPYKNSYGKEHRQDKLDVEEKIRALAEIGIEGVELFSDGSNMEELEHLLSLANELCLFVSIGSDYHDAGKGLVPSELGKLNDKVKNEVKKWINL